MFDEVRGPSLLRFPEVLRWVAGHPAKSLSTNTSQRQTLAHQTVDTPGEARLCQLSWVPDTLRSNSLVASARSGLSNIHTGRNECDAVRFSFIQWSRVSVPKSIFIFPLLTLHSLRAVARTSCSSSLIRTCE